MSASEPFPALSAILLAAGMSKRMGDINKLLLDVDGMPMVHRTAAAVLASGVLELVVVLGHDREAVTDALHDLPCKIIHNPDYAGGQMTSVRVGLAAVSDDAEAVMICLADQPLLSPDDYRHLALAFMSVCPGQIAVPTVDGERGNPIILPAHLKNEILDREMRFGCRNLIQSNPALVAAVEMKSSNFICDIDTPEAYRTYTK